VCNECIHLFPLCDAIDFQIQSNVNEVVSQLGVSECKVYQSTVMESKSKCQFDYLREIHILDKIDDDMMCSNCCENAKCLIRRKDSSR
jgi:hypothetical protein